MKNVKNKKPIYHQGFDGYSIHDILDYIQKHFGINPYDYHNSLEHYDKWCDSQGINGLDHDGKNRKNSSIWFAQYKSHPKGQAQCPKYEDFFDWFFRCYQHQYEESFEFDTLYHLTDSDTPPMVKKTLLYMQRDFGNTFRIYQEQF